MEIKCVSAALAASLFGMSVVASGLEPTVDGRLDEAVWGNAEWHGDFRRLANHDGQLAHQQTSFAFVFGERTLYLGVRCAEKRMDLLRDEEPKHVWTADNVDFTLSPSGSVAEFYHFAVSAKGGFAAALYNEEGGKTSPDPYAPVWQHAVDLGEDGWTVEVAIPYSSFYMTRNAAWRKTWRLNVCRRSIIGEKESSSWAPLRRHFTEPKGMRELDGFPMRTVADDVAIVSAAVRITRLEGDRPAGMFACRAFVAEPGEYEFAAFGVKPTVCALKSGWNDLSFGCAYEKTGYYAADLSLSRGGRTFSRQHPIEVLFEPIDVRLTQPSYRNNFYPGQDASRIAGTVAALAGGPVEVTVEGTGIPRQTVTSAANGSFAFATPGFTVGGEATLRFKGGCGETTLRVRNLKPSGHRMAWIENGRVVVDGKPVFVREVCHPTYHIGKWFAKMLKADADRGLTTWANEIGLEPNRLVRGSEQKEGRKHQRPSKEVFDAIDAAIEANRDKEFAFYYMSDEPECRGVSPVYLKYLYDHVAEKDPYHPIRCASRAASRYIDTADFFETHPYIDPHNTSDGRRVYGRAFNELGSYVDDVVRLGRPDKAMGFYQTSFAYRYNDPTSDYPTFAEAVCHVWAGVIRGAVSLNSYATHDLGDRAAVYEGTRYTFTSMAALEDYLLFGKRTRLALTKDYEAVRYELGDGSKVFVVVNFTQDPVRADVPGLSGRYHEFRGARTFENPRMFELAPLEVVIGTTKTCDAGLPTYAEVQAKIDAAEKERTSRDNQLLDRFTELSFAASNGENNFYKLIDGTRFVYAWEHKGAQKPPFVEFADPKGAFEFSKLAVYGSGFQDVIVEVRTAGRWTALAPRNVVRDGYRVELDFAAVVRTSRVRLTFPPAVKGKPVTVELYEVELPRAEKGLPRYDLKVPQPVATGTPGAVADMPCAVNWSFGPDKLETTDCKTVEFADDFGWMEAKFLSFEQKEVTKYTGWAIYAKRGEENKEYVCGGPRTGLPGLYTVKMPRLSSGRGRVHLFLYNQTADVAYVRNVDRPPNCLSAEVVGDEVVFTLRLEKPCEDVTVSLLAEARNRGLQSFRMNGGNTVDLRPVDGDTRNWRGTIRIGKVDRPAKPRQVVAKAVVVGGALDLPIFTNIDAEFN